MALTGSQYDSIMHDYDEQQSRDRSISKQRLDDVHTRIPEFAALEEQLHSLHGDAAIRFVSGDKDALVSLHDKVRVIEANKAALLKDHGFPADYLEPVYRCPDCKDTGYIDNVKCHCFRQKEARILYQHSNLDKLLETENFDKLSESYLSGEELEHFRRTVRCCHSFIDDFDTQYRNICFYGSVGTGKSFLSCCIAHDLLESGHSVLYFSAVKFFELLSDAAFHKNSGLSLSEVMRDINDCDLLIIDDLGTEVANQFTISNLFSCINERHLNQRSTIISTNLSLEKLRDLYSDRVFSRISCYYELNKLTGPDIRIESKKTQRCKKESEDFPK